MTHTEFLLQYQYNIKQTNDENKERSVEGLLVDPKPNSSKKHHKNSMADSNENY